MPQPNSKPPESYRKNCTLCATSRDVLVRCQVDPASLPEPLSETSKPETWHFVCPGSCWRRVSGGVIDGDLKEGREGYRYGGMWKNKHAGVSAKVPRRLKGRLGREGGGSGRGGGGEEGVEAKEDGGEGRSGDNYGEE